MNSDSHIIRIMFVIVIQTRFLINRVVYINLFVFTGTDPNFEDYDRRTPLHSAIVKGSRSYECVRLLLDGGADVNHKDR